ncbi:MAG: methyltransferase domain-containing protein [Candidatus Lloydbacteria bacterium]|nr:methyltransferase domain-containing protein [Candidatus Lloydbacteria bacterium]
MFSDPQKNVAQLDVREGDHVADFGAGSGAYAFAIARRVGSSGRVYAIDIQKELLAKLKNEARRENIFNIEIIWSDLDNEKGTALREASVDACVVSNLLFQVSSKEQVIAEVWRILKPGGKILIIDWNDSYGGLGPTNQDVFSKQSAQELLSKEGFVYEKDIDAGAYHYGMIFKKNNKTT